MSNMTRVDALLAGKIHQAFTVAADQLVQRGYVTQPERIALSGLIGNMLDTFNSTMDAKVASAMVDPECADQIAMMKEQHMTKTQAPASPAQSLVNLVGRMFKQGGEKPGDKPKDTEPDDDADDVEKPDDADADDVEDAKKSKPMHSASKEFANEFSIFKQSDGTWRWVGVTSSGFRDGDRQLVTSKALEADVARMNTEQAKLGLSARKEIAEGLGELSWWHVMLKEENPQELYPGIAVDIASCDASEMAGVSNIESGVFYDNAVGERMAAQQKELGFSREFFYPASEPDAQGNFNRIHTYRRTILPARRAANPMSAETLSIQKESKENKMSKLKELVGDEAYKNVLTRVAQKEQELERAGVEKKETDATPLDVNALTETILAKVKETALTADVVKTLVSEGIAVAFKDFATEFAKVQGEQVQSAKKERDDLVTEVTELRSMVKELWGDAPKSITSGYKPSEAAHNILDPKDTKGKEKLDKAKKEMTPLIEQMKAQPMGEFAVWMTQGSEGMDKLTRNGQ